MKRNKLDARLRKKLEIVVKGDRASGRTTTLQMIAAILKLAGLSEQIVVVDPGGPLAKADERPEDRDTHSIEIWE